MIINKIKIKKLIIIPNNLTKIKASSLIKISQKMNKFFDFQDVFTMKSRNNLILLIIRINLSHFQIEKIINN
jgi:hypothetical protein